MVEVTVCVGSSCHMKGSYQVIQTFQQIIKERGLENKVALKASFCMGRCLTGISMAVDGEPIEHVGFANAADVFYEHVLPKIEED
ncbi:(2Fe-2S) ferredoxin domain-containing protein [Neobittarella massiliensis]|uniref:(2Fe-2S) ferredoxin domain-containing protein n=2 Tax=Oscillospiraceae TaxID=216572 RepID=A0A8J6IMF3_9FIRM|nr:(2Fe-2S) ferredoxin domain-containing protein [Neobittarella massiliensis]MBC3516234.1 (2Fe-2S) ferredoxin domain-containing protein [Neobittarella massiliensis]SCJ86284.1 NADH:ubiquinone oxidoreductase 24 kD subunit [uncultured Anaerotruncus sp.]